MGFPASLRRSAPRSLSYRGIIWGVGFSSPQAFGTVSSPTSYFITLVISYIYNFLSVPPYCILSLSQGNLSINRRLKFFLKIIYVQNVSNIFLLLITNSLMNPHTFEESILILIVSMWGLAAGASD
ncbi:MAG: hypothetical protein XD44_0788 [Methanobacteriaceae archaeon 41_258]|nr:MAG: hypothetical protein XD44_0788 [Methanobacteriaceae archaeon 41_258]